MQFLYMEFSKDYETLFSYFKRKSLGHEDNTDTSKHTELVDWEALIIKGDGKTMGMCIQV